jgi:hypothetical protein
MCIVRSFLTHVDTAGSHRVCDRTGDFVDVAVAGLLPAADAGEATVTVAIL